MTKDDSLKKALKVRARLAKERNSPNVKKNGNIQKVDSAEAG